MAAAFTKDDPYTTLGVPRGASKHNVRQRFLELSRTRHPDKLPPGANDEVKQLAALDFVKIRAAYEDLRDSTKWRGPKKDVEVWPSVQHARAYRAAARANLEEAQANLDDLRRDARSVTRLVVDEPEAMREIFRKAWRAKIALERECLWAEHQVTIAEALHFDAEAGFETAEIGPNDYENPAAAKPMAIMAIQQALVFKSSIEGSQDASPIRSSPLGEQLGWSVLDEEWRNHFQAAAAAVDECVHDLCDAFSGLGLALCGAARGSYAYCLGDRTFAASPRGVVIFLCAATTQAMFRCRVEILHRLRSPQNRVAGRVVKTASVHAIYDVSPMLSKAISDMDLWIKERVLVSGPSEVEKSFHGPHTPDVRNCDFTSPRSRTGRNSRTFMRSSILAEFQRRGTVARDELLKELNIVWNESCTLYDYERLFDALGLSD